MPFNFHSIDAANLLFIPIMVITAVKLFKQRKSLFDQELTRQDRILLQQVVLFLLLPLVVLCHELGHVFAIKLFGGHVKEFHYAFVWGYVVPDGNFTPDQTVWLYLSGNLVQVILGFMALAVAFIASSPPIVALSIYLFLWSTAGTAILYALMSFTGLYGDWVAIYTTAASHLIPIIFIVHLFLAAFIFYCIYGQLPKVWFVKKTQPKWCQEQKLLQENIRQDPSVANFLKLFRSFYSAGLLSQAKLALKAVLDQDPNNPDGLMMAGALALASNKPPLAIKYFLQASEQPGASDSLRAKAHLAAGKSYLQIKQFDLAMPEFRLTSLFDPEMADPHYFAAVIFDATGKHLEADQEMLTSVKLNWLDEVLWNDALERLKKLKLK